MIKAWLLFIIFWQPLFSFEGIHFIYLLLDTFQFLRSTELQGFCVQWPQQEGCLGT